MVGNDKFLPGVKSMTTDHLGPYTTKFKAKVIAIGTGTDKGMIKVARPTESEDPEINGRDYVNLIGTTSLGEWLWCFSDEGGILAYGRDDERDTTPKNASVPLTEYDLGYTLTYADETVSGWPAIHVMIVTDYYSNYRNRQTIYDAATSDVWTRRWDPDANAGVGAWTSPVLVGSGGGGGLTGSLRMSAFRRAASFVLTSSSSTPPVYTQIPFDTEIVDELGLLAGSVPSTTLTFTEAGRYYVSVQEVLWEDDNAQYRHIRLLHNANIVNATPASDVIYDNKYQYGPAGIINAIVGDTIKVDAFITSNTVTLEDLTIRIIKLESLQGEPGTDGTDGTGWINRGVYSAGVTYVPNDAVEYQGSYWLAKIGTTGNTPPTLPTEENTQWSLIVAKGDVGDVGNTGPAGLVNRGAWSGATAYVVNDAVSYRGSYWRALASNTNSTPTTTNANWERLAEGYNDAGAWANAVAYSVDDIVTYNGSVYRVLTNHTSATVDAPDTGTANSTARYALWARGLNPRGSWDSAITYYTGDTATRRGSQWRALRTNTNVVPSLTASLDWQLLVRGYASAGAWATATFYYTDQMVTYNGATYRSLNDHTSSSNPSVDTTNYELWSAKGDTGPKGTRSMGAWSVSQAYLVDDLVLKDGSTWRAIAGHTGVEPPSLPTESNASWELFAKRGADGVAIIDVNDVQLFDDFISGLATAGNIGNLGWDFAVSTVTLLAGESGRPGIVRRSSGATSDNQGYLALRDAPATGVITVSDMFDMIWSIRVNQITTAQQTVRVGFVVDPTLNPGPSGIFFEHLGADDGAWHGVTRSGSVQSRTASLGTLDTNWVKLRIRRIDSTTIGFSLNGGTEVTLNTNVPAGAHTPAIYLRTLNANARTYDVDYFYMRLSGMNR